MEILIKHRHKR